MKKGILIGLDNEHEAIILDIETNPRDENSKHYF